MWANYMKNQRSFLSTVAILAILPAIAWAHHSRSNFDLDTVLEFHGVITEYSWRNPHTFATLAVKDDAGESKELLLELNSVSVLTRQGWTRDTLSVGDEVTVFANPDHDGDKNLYYSNYFVLPDGQMIASAGGGAPGLIPQTPRRQVDSTARSEDLSGTWVIEGGRFNRRGGNQPGAAPPARNAVSLGGQVQASGLPLTALGQAESDNWNVEENPFFSCVSKTPPSITSVLGAHRIIRESDDRIIIRHEILDVERIIHMNLTEHDPEIEPSHLGHAIGWFDDETLVVDSALFVPTKWGIGSGISSSDQKHVVERYTLIDDGHRIRHEYTIEDPIYLSEPVALSQTLSLDPTYPWQDEYACDPEASSRHIVD
jgi:hypothetical protein